MSRKPILQELAIDGNRNNKSVAEVWTALHGLKPILESFLESRSEEDRAKLKISFDAFLWAPEKSELQSVELIPLGVISEANIWTVDSELHRYVRSWKGDWVMLSYRSNGIVRYGLTETLERRYVPAVLFSNPSDQILEHLTGKMLASEEEDFAAILLAKVAESLR